ncbi:MAG TPA: trypsin-like peptidase domain-containing protein [Pseudonocardia sp.]|nr:trypsin-like peptidase domain-containing protein [Pseudonocardia sp.]
MSHIGRPGEPEATDGVWRQSAGTPGPDGYPHYSSWPPREQGHWAAPPEPRRRGPFGALLAVILVALLAVAAVSVGRGILHSGALSAFTSSSDTPVAAPDTGTGTDQVEEPARAALGQTDLTALAAKVAPGLVNINTELGYQNAASAGTGIVLSPNGEVLTNNHVINGATAIRVTSIGNGRTYRATVVGYDRAHDIAVLQMKGATGLRTATIGDSGTVKVGDPVAAIGNAGGVGGTPTTSGGQVTSLNRSISPSDELTGSVERLSGLIEVAANVQPGDSGGPLVDSAGRVVGVDTAASANYRYQATGGTGYAIPINDAMAIARQIQGGSATETVHIGPTGMLGVSVLSSPGSRYPGSRYDGGDASSRYVPAGVVVAGVQAGSPAEQAGLGRGDVIVALDGATVDSATTLTTLIGQHHPGDQVTLQWVDSTGQRQSAPVGLVVGPPN